MKLTAKFIKLLEPISGKSSNTYWTKQDFIVVTKETYPKNVVISNWNNQYDISFLTDETYYDLEINIESKLYNGIYYSTVKLIGQPQMMQNGLASLVSGFKLFKAQTKIITILPATQGPNWTKQEVIFEQIEQGNKCLSGLVINNKIDLTSFSKGDEVSLDFYIESREYNQKWYTDFKLWKIELIKKGNSNNPPVFLSTHPDPGNRVEKFREAKQENGCLGNETYATEYKRIISKLP